MRRSAFTLIELLLAAAAAAVVLAALYGVLSRVVKSRDARVASADDMRLRERAAGVIRNDLRGAWVSGGKLANALEGSLQSPRSSHPGYLRFTATTAREGDLGGDVILVEYYLLPDEEVGLNNPEPTPTPPGMSPTPEATAGGALATVTPAPTPDPSAVGETATLVRAVTRDLLATTLPNPEEKALLRRVQKFEATFYDGTAWQEEWPGGSEGRPLAVRVRLQQAPRSEKFPTPPPLEITVPITTEPFNPETGNTTTASSATPTPTATPSPTPESTPNSDPNNNGNNGNNGGNGGNNNPNNGGSGGGPNGPGGGGPFGGRGNPGGGPPR